MAKSRIIQSGILVLLLIGLVSTFSFSLSFWNTVNVTRTVEITEVNQAVELDIHDISIENRTLVLVPEGYAVSDGESESITLEYTVGVSRELLSSTNLNIIASQILIGGNNEYSHLVGIDILGMGDDITLDLFNDTILVTVIITLDEPVDQQEAIIQGLDLSTVNVEDSQVAYDQIQGQTISFILTFNLEARTSIES